MSKQEEDLIKDSFRSPEIEEIISRVPSSIVRWGMLVIFLIMISIGCISWFIRYPDLLPADVVITTDPPPFNLVSRKSGNLELIKANNALVQKGEVIGLIRSNSSIDAVLLLEQIVRTTSSLSDTLLFTDLGDLQEYYAVVIQAETSLQNLKINRAFDLQISELQKQQSSHESLSRSLLIQQKLSAQELELAHERFKTDSLLFTKQVIAPLDFNNSKTTWIQQQRNLRNAESAIINNQIQLNNLSKQIADLQIQKIEKHENLLQGVINARQNLLGQIITWKENNVFISPCDGTVSYLGFLDNQSFVEGSKLLFAVIPNKGRIIGRASLPKFGSGKVREGQLVNIRLDNYPFEQFGMLKGRITTISKIPTDDKYWVTIEVAQQLITSQNKKLDFHQQLTGTTEIITEDLRLLERFLYNFRRLVRVH